MPRTLNGILYAKDDERVYYDPVKDIIVAHYSFSKTMEIRERLEKDTDDYN